MSPPKKMRRISDYVTGAAKVKHAKQIRGRVIVAATLALIAAASEAQEWQFGLTPYIWLPNIEGNGTTEKPPTGDGEPAFEIGPVDYLEHLDFVLMLSGEARKGRWGLRADVVYVDFGNERSSVQSVSDPDGVVEIPVNAGTTTAISGLESQASIGYMLLDQPGLSLEILGGLRYLDVSFDLDWRFDGPLNSLPQSGSVSQSAQPLDAIVGARGRFGFGRGKWFTPFHLDVGAGDSELTWQLFAGVGYAFSWGDLLLAYRHLEYDQKHGELLEGLSLSGPALGASFRL
jgi:hypothetical protein